MFYIEQLFNESNGMARSPDLNKQMKIERQQDICRGALKLFATRGLVATKISDIAKECNMSQGLVYHYYNNKDEIFIELIDNAFDKLIDACNWLVNQKMSPSKKILMALEKILELINDDKTFAYNSLLIAQASINSSIPDRAKEIIIKKNRIPYEIIGKVFKQGMEEKLFKSGSAEELATLFWTTINGLAIYKSSHGDSFSLPSIELLKSLFI